MKFEDLQGKTTSEALPIIDAATAEDANSVEGALAGTVVAADVFFAEMDRLMPGMRAVLIDFDGGLLTIRIEQTFGLQRAVTIAGDDEMFRSAAEDYLADLEPDGLGGPQWSLLLTIGSMIEQAGLTLDLPKAGG